MYFISYLKILSNIFWSYLFSLISSSQIYFPSLPFQLHVPSKKIETNLCCSNVLVCAPFQWTMVSLSGDTLLEKMVSSSLGNQLALATCLGLGLYAQFPCSCWDLVWLWVLCILSQLLKIMYLPYCVQKGLLPCSHPQPLAFNIFMLLLPQCPLSFGREWLYVPFRTDHSIVSHSLHLVYCVFALMTIYCNANFSEEDWEVP